MHMLLDPVRLENRVLVLGMFDGVHQGHQELLKQGNALADRYRCPLSVCTYAPHPLRVVTPGRHPKLLTTLPEKAALMTHFGVHELCVTTFDRARADQPPEEYLEDILRVYSPVAVVCGYNFTFGQGGRGDSELLMRFGEKHGFEVVVVPEVVLEGAAVSSSRIRRLLVDGELEEATRLMGHAYTLTGRVADGKHIGRTMGFPTANLAVSKNKVLPAFGVYACWLETRDARYPAVVNVGRHPTLPEGPVTVEAYVLDEQLVLYGEKARLTFLRFQRRERPFDSVAALRDQIAWDTEECRNYFASLN